MPGYSYLRFGIASLDELLAKDGQGMRVPPGEASSFCLIGPDGTGKSVFALHLASAYRKENRDASTKVIYVSTDLRHKVAESMAKNFGLALPKNFETSDYSRLAQYLGGKEKPIAFIDLASDSAGDDWALIARIISLLDEPKAGQPRHLLIIDAIEGLETLSGETDAYGQKLSRRARIALLMRLASHKCHLGLIVEESTEYDRLPEGIRGGSGDPATFGADEWLYAANG